MAINKVENTNDEKDFNFLTNQSSILLASDTNNVTVNGVNVIVDKPKVGDVMCVKDGQVVWIDGLSITPAQLSQEIEPVGICVSINGNKAMVRYRTEYTEMWAAGDRFEIPYFSYMVDGKSNSLKIEFKVNDGVTSSSFFGYENVHNRYDFSYAFNNWLSSYHNTWSSELVELDSDKSIYASTDEEKQKLDIKVSTNTFKNRVIVTAKYTGKTDNKIGINIPNSNNNQGKTNGEFVTANYIGSNDNYYKNNGFISQYFGGCCRAKFYEHYSKNGHVPTKVMENINKIPDNNDDCPVKLTSFIDTDTSYCKILRDNFSNYDEYIDSMMIKLPCGKGGAITELPSGKENTYKLANCTFLDNTQPVGAVERNTLYPAAYRVSTVGVHAPGLEAGNWWLPSLAEMVQMMHDVTYDSTKSLNAKLDIVNTVLDKMVKFYNTNWTMLDASKARWTCSKFDETNPYARSYGASGVLSNSHMSYSLTVSPITIYEF